MEQLLSTCLFICFSFCSFSQEKELKKILGAEFVKQTSFEKYRFNETDQRVIVLPSATYQGDTSGLAFGNEFVNFRFNYYEDYPDEKTYYRSHKDSANGKPMLVLTPKDTVIPPPLLTRYIRQNPVTVSEYLEFQNWVRDSLVREILYKKEPGMQKAIKMLGFNEEYARASAADGDLDLGNREMLREWFYLNWEQPLNYQKIPVETLAELYLDPNECFGKPEIDPRKLTYHFVELALTPFPPLPGRIKGFGPRSHFLVNYSIPTLVDTYSWMKYAREQSFDMMPRNDQGVWSVIAQRYLESFPDAPVTGITGMQAKAYCAWKKEQIQNEITAKDLPYFVEVTLPSIYDLDWLKAEKKPFVVPAFDPTERWRIPVKEYLKFVAAVKDSILNEQLYFALHNSGDTLRLVKYPKGSHYTGKSPTMNFYNGDSAYVKRYFPLSYDRSVLKKYPKLVDSIKQLPAYRNAECNSFYRASLERSYTGPLEADENGLFQAQYQDTIPYLSGKDLNLGMVNNRGQSSGVRSHEFLGQFFVYETISSVPEADLAKQKKGELVQDLVYEQALAFYNWKYGILTSGRTADWKQFVLPDQEQFERIQKGEKILISEIQVDYPSPIFRYVVHLIPYNDD